MTDSDQTPDPDEPVAQLVRRRTFLIEVPGLGPVTYARGEAVPRKHYEHVDGRDRRWFEAIEDAGEGASDNEETEQANEVDQDAQ